MSRKPWRGFKEAIEYCPETGKVCYDKVSARTAANYRYKEDHTELRIYACPHCQRAGMPKVWHLTHNNVQRDYDDM